MLRVFFGFIFLILIVDFVEGKDDVPANLIAGKKIPANAKLKKGDKLVAWYEKKAYLVEVLEVKPNNKLKIVWVESKEETDDVLPNELYDFGDSTQLRKSRTAALPEAFRSFDKNADGQISLSEWERTKYAEFKRLDKNNDGILTPKELTAKGVTVTSTAVATTTPSKDSEAKANAKPAPVSLAEYKDKIGQTFTFALTGSANAGEVRGTESYSIDSNLAAAAVHAGILKDGEAGTVTVSIVPPTNSFTASTAHGVTSVESSVAGLAFRFK